MKDILMMILQWAVPFACAGLYTAITAVVSGKKKESEAMVEGLKSLLRAEIVRNYEKYKDKGYCPIYARDPLTKAYNAYHALGGNSTATALCQKTLDLPTEPTEEKNE